LVVVKDVAAFNAHFKSANSFLIAGTYSGSQLLNKDFGFDDWLIEWRI
jgi:hypothetical protein